ncbi:MAG: metal ABC transporter ATP-binding protein [Acholeplasmataceae bacterium]|jgi:manganese/zinc/iron transport system ATP- binding protein
MEKEKDYIIIEDLTISYEIKPVLWDIDLKIPKGALMAIVGPNGAGKSTLIKGMLNLVNVVAGYVKFFGKNYQEIKRKIAYVPQRGSVDWDFPTTVFDVVLMGRYGDIGWLKRPTKEDKRIALECLERVGMTSYKNRQISELSGGQQQRVFLARALAQKADIYMMDEPFQGVDVVTEEAIVNIFKTLKEEGKTLIIVHHDLKTVPQYFDHVALINLEVIAAGKVKDVFTEENIKKTYQERSLKRTQEDA